MFNQSSDIHYLHARIAAYTYSSLALGPLACLAGLVAIIAECRYCGHRVFRERLSFHAVAVSEILAGLMQLTFGIFYFRILRYNESGMGDIISEIANAVYIIAIVFCTSTILEISFRRWVDINSLRVGGIRPLSNRHWFVIAAFTFVATVVIFLNKVNAVARRGGAAAVGAPPKTPGRLRRENVAGGSVLRSPLGLRPRPH